MFEVLLQHHVCLLYLKGLVIQKLPFLLRYLFSQILFTYSHFFTHYPQVKCWFFFCRISCSSVVCEFLKNNCSIVCELRETFYLSTYRVTGTACWQCIFEVMHALSFLRLPLCTCLHVSFPRNSFQRKVISDKAFPCIKKSWNWDKCRCDSHHSARYWEQSQGTRRLKAAISAFPKV